MYAIVAKNLAFGKGYAQSTALDGTPGLRLFDPAVGTGPTVILPAAGLIYVVGNQVWAPGFVTATLSLAFILLIAAIIVRQTSLCAVSAFICTAILLLYNLTAGLHFEQWYSLLGEIPAAMLCVIGAAKLADEPETRSSVVFSSLMYGLAFTSKLLALLAFISVALWLIWRALFGSTNRRRLMVDCVIAVMVFLTPFALFEIWKLRILGFHLYALNTKEFVAFFRSQSNAASVGQGGFTAACATALHNYSKHSMIMRQHFGFSPITLAVVALLVGTLIYLYAESTHIQFLFTCLLSGALVNLCWWLCISNGWPRYALIGLFLYFFAVASVVFVRKPWPLVGACVALLLIAFWAGYARLSSPIKFVLEYRYTHTPRLANLIRTVQFLKERQQDEPFVMGWWGTAGDIEYAMPTVGNFIQSDHIAPDYEGRDLLLVRNKVWVDWETTPQFTAWEQMCSQVLLDAPPYLVSQCPGRQVAEGIRALKVLGLPIYGGPVYSNGNPPVAIAPESAARLATGGCQMAGLVGFHDVENWGVWSGQDPAAIKLKHAITGPLEVNVTAYAINDHTAHVVNVTIGGETKTISLTPDTPRTYHLQYTIPKPASEIVLSGIKPVSPKDAGLGSDMRKLAVGLVRIDCAAQHTIAR
jgi:hypothetical protein